MKKFVKYAAIIGCILILVGAGIATVSFSLGGDPFHAAEDIEERFEDYTDRFGERYVEYGPTAEYEDVTIEASETYTEDVTELVMDKLSDVEICIEDGEVTAYTEPGLEDALLVCESGCWDHVSYKNMEKYQKLEILAKNGEQYVLILPETWNLSEFDVECTGGQFDGNGIRANEAEFSVRGGNIGVVQRNGDDIKLECTRGYIEWSADGYLPAQVDAECAGGDINMYIDAEIDSEKVGYEIEYAGGSIDFFGTSFDGLDENYRNAKEGMPHFDLEIVGGSITVQ